MFNEIEPIVNIKDIQTLIDYNKKYPERVVFGKSSANELISRLLKSKSGMRFKWKTSLLIKSWNTIKQ